MSYNQKYTNKKYISRSRATSYNFGTVMLLKLRNEMGMMKRGRLTKLHKGYRFINIVTCFATEDAIQIVNWFI
jgi:hypothetical protein